MRVHAVDVSENLKTQILTRKINHFAVDLRKLLNPNIQRYLIKTKKILNNLDEMYYSITILERLIALGTNNVAT